MRILKRTFTKNGAGTIKVQADESEDMYYLFNLVAEGDEVTASTTRNVVHESKTGSTRKERVQVKNLSVI